FLVLSYPVGGEPPNRAPVTVTVGNELSPVKVTALISGAWTSGTGYSVIRWRARAGPAATPMRTATDKRTATLRGSLMPSFPLSYPYSGGATCAHGPDCAAGALALSMDPRIHFETQSERLEGLVVSAPTRPMP